MDRSTPPPSRKSPSPEPKETRAGEYEVVRSPGTQRPTTGGLRMGEMKRDAPRAYGTQPVTRTPVPRGVEQPVMRSPVPRGAEQPVMRSPQPARGAPQPVQASKFHSPFAVLATDSDDDDEWPLDEEPTWPFEEEPTW